MIIPIHQTFDKITFVTMCFNLGESLNKNFKRDNRHYIEFYAKSALDICNAIENIIIFCDEECGKYLKQKLSNKKCEVIICDLLSLPPYRQLEDYQRIYKKMEGSIIARRYIPMPFKLMKCGCVVRMGHSEENGVYSCLMNCKIHFINETTKSNPFNTQYFYWIDAGLSNDRYEHLWDNFDGKITGSGSKKLLNINAHYVRTI